MFKLRIPITNPREVPNVLRDHITSIYQTGNQRVPPFYPITQVECCTHGAAPEQRHGELLKACGCTCTLVAPGGGEVVCSIMGEGKGSLPFLDCCCCSASTVSALQCPGVLWSRCWCPVCSPSHLYVLEAGLCLLQQRLPGEGSTNLLTPLTSPAPHQIHWLVWHGLVYL